MTKIYIVLITITFTLNAIALKSMERDFFNDTIDQVSKTVDLVTDYGANGTDAKDDSAALQKAIDEMTATSRGGKICIPSGIYYVSGVAIKSNVHLELDKGTTIRPENESGAVFSIGANSAAVSNVSVRCKTGEAGDRFAVDLSAVKPSVSATAVMAQNVDNFLISDINVVETSTVHSALRFNMATYNGDYFFPRNGVVKNVDDFGAHNGYGTVQVGGGTHILFDNITGTGGVTLRLESGSGGLKAVSGSMFDIVGRNITCTNGLAAVMISPHAMKNGTVDIDGVFSDSCRSAVRIDRGDTRNGSSPGHFAADSVVKNVTAVYGTNAQLKFGSCKWVPVELRDQISAGLNPDGISYSGPACCAVIYTAFGEEEGHFHVTVTNVNQVGFDYQPQKIMFEADAVPYRRRPDQAKGSKSKNEKKKK